MTIAVASRSALKWNWALLFVFFYFLTLSVDLISIDIAIFKLKLSHLVGFLTLAFLASIRKGVFFERRYLLLFSVIFVSMLISSLHSICFFRSLVYCVIFLFTIFAYFFVPINIVQLFDENKILRLYIASYLIIGSYAALQFFGSMVGLELPFSVQKVLFVRGSAFTHEPSFYALYAIPFVSFLNARWLLTKVHNRNNKTLCSPLQRREERLRSLRLFFANVCLLVSTSTTAVLSYLTFFIVVLFLKMNPLNRLYFKGFRIKLLKFFSVSLVGFALSVCLFFELFKRTFLKFFFTGIEHESFQDRFTGIKLAFNAFLENPTFGLGLGGVGPYLYKNEYYPGFGQQILEVDRLGLVKFEPTNVFTEILSSVGAAGFLGFSLVFFLIWKSFRKILNEQRISPTERINILSIFISMIVMLVCLQVNQGLFRAYIWVHLGIGVGYVAKINSRFKERKIAAKVEAVK